MSRNTPRHTIPLVILSMSQQVAPSTVTVREGKPLYRRLSNARGQASPTAWRPEEAENVVVSEAVSRPFQGSASTTCEAVPYVLDQFNSRYSIYIRRRAVCSSVRSIDE